MVAAAATALNLGLAQMVEQQAQTLFFELRGAVPPPKDVVILAIDETSLSQQEFYQTDPQKYAALEPIQTWPWKRSAYAIAIEKLMAAGAKSVALDVVFSNPSSYGAADDQRFAQVLQRYAGRVVLASQYAEVETPQGEITQLSLPTARLRTQPDVTGSINFFVEPDGRIHRLGNQFLKEYLHDAPPQEAQIWQQQRPLTLAEAALKAAQIAYPSDRGNTIFFYGPSGTFDQVPFWYVLDPANWDTYLKSGAYFKDKIVLIGATAAIRQDFHPVPFAESGLYPQPMAGVELHANAIASLLQGKTLANALPNPLLRGLFVLLGAAGAAVVFSRPRQPLRRWAWAMGLAMIWAGAGYVAFVYGRVIVPTAVPVVAIVLGGFSQLVAGSAAEQLRKRQLRNTLKQYATSPIVREIISQQDDLQDLLRERERIVGGKVLSGRYRIVRVLGSGGFSETYVAEDTQRPGRPLCVVKQLRIISNSPNTFRVARRLFATEAETLEQLGQHDQIPQLMASFEQDQEFYLVQEYIAGHPLASELMPRKPLTESQVIVLLHDLLQVLEFVHAHGVIHRDLKPPNIIRRKLDGKLVLIDFGIAKKITTQLLDLERETKMTVAVGTPGYMPNEQAAGRPHFSSDIYALGMIGIEALTGKAPHQLKLDPKTGEVAWFSQTERLSLDFAAVLSKMVRYDFTQRYLSAQEAREALEQLSAFPGKRHVDQVLMDQAIDGTAEHVSLLDAEPETVPLPDDWVDQTLFDRDQR
jgi:CHASE2 domain-containing sensor protein